VKTPIRTFAAWAATALLLAACSDSPTAGRTAAAPRGPALDAAPTVTVTNSGGYPLISWNALSGATDYTVTYVESRTIIYKPSLDTANESYEATLTRTTGTSYLDTAHAYTGDTMCTSYGTYQTRITNYRYRVTAYYPTGTASTLVSAPVSPC
jgi:hypothetical protein